MPQPQTDQLLIASSTYKGPFDPLPLTGHSIAWSPTNEKIAFAYMTSVIVANNDGTNVHKTINTGYVKGRRAMMEKRSLEWSPDGTCIACKEQDPKIYVAHLATNESYLLAEGYDFHWKSDVQLIYWNNFGAFIADTKRRDIDTCNYLHGEISPDGQRIITNFRERVKISDIDGKNSYFLDCTKDSYDPVLWIDYAQWSPEGTKIAYSQTSDKARIFIIDADGTNKRYIAEGVNPEWSPNGIKIAFTNRFHTQVFVINVDGTNLMHIGTGSSVAWSPNSNQLLYSGEDGIHIVTF